ncbi:carbohydrate ABC transporter permease [Cohnella silvisoli]|uniref:Carbohydrate ABC transporter permease n=1 Tax=Cohnella silvisoli TaxID=2873699 RepID=A0ABV1KRK9_9BACL|nr:carbohydrate ABC transporter permease [Cohnella silvisoli]MCD9022441.1 carbohydrate ABC transporter permease [Cohnella silvisoli]
MVEKRLLSDYIWRFVLLIWGSSILLPLIWIFYEALKTNVEFFADIWALPSKANWKNFSNAWTMFGIGQSVLNTLYYVGASLIIGTFLVALKTYALVRLEFRGRKLIWGLIMLSLFLPGITALVPQYVLMRSIHLTNSLTGLVILDSFGENVFFLLLLAGFMKSIPKEVEESAFIDGASLFKVFFRIILPLSMPGIVTVAIFRFLGLYNNFIGPFIYLSDQKKYTIGLNIYNANTMMQYKSNWVTLFAGVMIVLIPSIVVYVLFQKRILEGATLGAVKG